jgi:diaminopimelate epimerase
VQLTKHHGLGNDFLVWRRADLPDDAADRAVTLCNRRRGVGADGLIFGLDPVTIDTDMRMVLFNSDGSRAEMSGNGIRCLAQAVVAHDETASLLIETDGGIRHVAVVPTETAGLVRAEVDMGPIAEGPSVEAVSLEKGEIRCGSATIGNPHLVVLVEDPAAVDLRTAGPRHEAAFAGGINVEFIAPVGESTIELTVWERGAGITEACGSGACAAAFHAHGWGISNDRVEVHMPGGIAQVQLGDTVTLSGPAVLIASIEVPGE